MRKAYDRLGRNWQTTAFVRPVSLAELAAVRRRRPLPTCLALMDAAAPAVKPAAEGSPPPSPAANGAGPHAAACGGAAGAGADAEADADADADAPPLAGLADAVRRLFAPDVAAARAVLAAGAGAADVAEQTRAFYAEMARLLARPDAGPQSTRPGAAE